MITLETGLPGAGKTLYCVDKLLRLLVGSEVKSIDDATGLEVITKRVIYSNINGLLFDHEKIGAGAEWSMDKTGAWVQPEGGDKFGLNNWHEWAKPGSIIVFDEIQKPWPKAAAGSKVPPCITALETHRHMGVDFICLTQHPMLIHGNLVQLVGRHLHVRRMGNMGLAIVYEWDGCSKTLLYKNALSKSPLRYSKDAFALYKSSELHTKTPRKIPTLVFGAIFGLIAMVAFAPTVYQRIGDRISPPPAKLASVSAPKPAAPVVPGQTSAAVVPVVAASGSVPAAAGGLSMGPAMPVVAFAGCARLRSICRCFDTVGGSVEKPADFCTDTTTPGHVAKGVKELLNKVPDLKPDRPDTSDSSLIAWVSRDRQIKHYPY